jgi:excisionase family DNA binding protein
MQARNADTDLYCKEDQLITMEKLYTVNEAAGLLSMHPESVCREIRSGEIQVEKLSPRRTRIPESELKRFIAERSVRYRPYGL